MSVARFRPSLSLREAVHFVGAGLPGKPALVREFERAFGRELLGNRSVILAPSGRIALYWILAALDMAPGDEVVTQAFNFTAVPAAIEAAGARPVFVDVARDSFGTDTVRLYMVSDAPPDKMQIWSEAGINGAWRMLNRLWDLVLAALGDMASLGTEIPADLTPTNRALRRKAHQCIMRVTDAIEGGFQFNTAIARSAAV